MIARHRFFFFHQEEVHRCLALHPLLSSCRVASASHIFTFLFERFLLIWSRFFFRVVSFVQKLFLVVVLVLISLVVQLFLVVVICHCVLANKATSASPLFSSPKALVSRLPLACISLRIHAERKQHLQQFTVTGACAHRRLRTGGSPASARGGVVVVLRRVVGQLVERIPLVSVVGTSKLKSVSQEE